MLLMKMGGGTIGYAEFHHLLSGMHSNGDLEVSGGDPLAGKRMHEE